MRVQNVASARAAAADTMRSIRVGPGGSTCRARHLASNASRRRASTSLTGQISAASHAVSGSSSARVDSRNPRRLRICARWKTAARLVRSYFANSAAGTFTNPAT